ncbi:uncharacterized protein LOC144647079 isoform X3 [Oculina patagonica]
MFHTPLCPKDCEIRHHYVINSLQALAPRFSSSMNATIFSPSRVTRGNNKDDFKKQVHKLLSTGWKKNKNVPESSKQFQLPLLHLASMFGKYEAVDWLLNDEGFDAAQRSSSSNETALHLVARHLYKALLSESTRLENMSISAKVANFEKVVSMLIAKEVSLFWAKDGLNRETPFHILANHLVLANSAEADSEVEDQSLAFYSKSFDVILKLLLAEEDARLSRKDIVQALSVKNSDGDTSLHILAKATKHGYRALKFLVKSLGSSELMKLKNGKNRSVMDIVNECYPGHEKELLMEEEGKKKPRASSSGNQEERTVDVVQFLNHSASNATSLCNPEPDLDHDTAKRNERCAIHTKHFPEGDSSESPAQEPVSSSQSPPGNDDHSSAEVSQPQTAPDQPIQVQVAPACSPPRRPQAQVRSIQVIGQATAGNPSPQTSAAAQPVQHIPIVFIKQEPVDDEHDAQCLFSNNSQRQNAFIIHTGPAVASPVQTPSPLQLLENSVIQLGDTPPSNPPSLGQGSQAVTNAASSSNQLSAAGTQTTALLQQRAQTLRTPSVSQQGGQTTVAPIVSQTSLSQTGAAADQSGRQVSPKSKGVQSKRKSAESVQEMALKTLSRYTTDYRIEFQHTPFCDKDCSIDHNPLILTLLSTSNRLISRGPVNSFTTLLETSKANFLKCLKKNFDSGFVKYLDISDDLGILQYPLIHLAGIFFKYTTIEMLVHLGFERNPRSQRTGEFPLHSTLRHGYNTGLKLYKSFALNRNFEKLFAKVFLSFSNETDMMELLSQQDQNGDTPLHVAAKRMIERPAPVTSSPDVVASAVPDSTQECESSSSKRGESNDASQVCKLNHSTEQHRNRAEFYIHCLGHILKRLQEVATKSRKVDINLVKPVLLVKNNDGETFLQILCKEHHIANVAITSVINRFPHVAFINCVKQCVPQSCWPAACLMSVFKDQSASTTSGVNQSQAVSSPMELSKPSDKQSVARPSNPESPKPSSDVSMTQVSPTPSTTASVKTVGLESSSTPLAATPIQRGAAVVPPTPGSNPSDLLDSVLTPVVANPGHATLRPNTKRKIIEALREDYTERLELAVKGRHEVEEDILKHRSKTGELAVVIAKKREEMEKLERELQVLQKEMWHKNQAVQALENSLDQFTKEEEELQKNLAVLQDADPEPPTKKSKTQGNDNSDEDTRM